VQQSSTLSWRLWCLEVQLRNRTKSCVFLHKLPVCVTVLYWANQLLPDMYPLCLKSKNCMGPYPAANRQHSQIKTEHCVSFRRSLSTLKLIWCIIYLASEKYTVSYAYFTRWKKINASAVWLPPEAWGPQARRAHLIRRHWSVCPHNKTKTDETTITKLATG